MSCLPGTGSRVKLSFWPAASEMETWRITQTPMAFETRAFPLAHSRLEPKPLTRHHGYRTQGQKRLVPMRRIAAQRLGPHVTSWEQADTLKHPPHLLDKVSCSSSCTSHHQRMLLIT